MAQGPEIHALLRASTTVPVAEVYAYDDSRSLIDRSYTLMERLLGRALSDVPQVAASLYDHVLEQVGDALRQMHALTADTYGYIGAHHPTAPQPTWWPAFRVMWNALHVVEQRAGGYSAGEAAYLSGLVDLDRALWGDPEIEFAVLDYCGSSEPAFWRGYGAARDESPEAQIGQRFYLLYELQKYIVTHLLRRSDTRSTACAWPSRWPAP